MDSGGRLESLAWSFPYTKTYMDVDASWDILRVPALTPVAKSNLFTACYKFLEVRGDENVTSSGTLLVFSRPLKRR